MSKHKPTKKLPPVEYLCECFDYDRDAGTLTWKRRPREHFATYKSWANWNGSWPGKIAGCADRKGYSVVRLDDVLYKGHRIGWKLMTGKEPPGTIDHRDGDPSNSCWSNLRTATRNEQQWNRGGNRNNTSGVKGVYSHQGKWVAQICRNYRNHYLGIFNTIEEARAVYEKHARRLRGEFFRES